MHLDLISNVVMRVCLITILFCAQVALSICYSQSVGVVNSDSLKQVLPEVKGTDRIDHLHLLVINVWLNYPEEAMGYAHEALLLSDSLEDRVRFSRSLRLKGGVYYYKADYDSALYYTRQSLRIAESVQDTSLINHALNNTGLIYYNLGSYQNALENLLRSLNLKIAKGEIYGRSQTLNNIGLVYNKLKDFKRAREYFFEALRFSEKHDDLNQQLYALNNIAGTYLSEGEVDEAKNFFERSMAIEVDNKNWKAVTMSGMAQIYLQSKEFDRAKSFFNRALDLREEIGDKVGISEVYYFYAKSAQLQSNYDSALLMLDRSQQIAEQIGSKDRKFENYELYVDLFKQLGDVDKAFDYQTQLLGLRDTLFNENMARNLAEIQLEIQKEESEALLTKKDEQLTANKKVTVFLVIIVILVVIILIITLVAFRYNRKTRIILEVQNQEILKQKEEIIQQKESLLEKNIALENAQLIIKQQNEKLEKYNIQLQQEVDQRTKELEQRNQELKLANLELDNFIYKSSHDIKGPLATLMGVCNVALLDVKDDLAKKYLEMLAESSAGLNDILARLKTVSDISSLEIKNEKIDFEKIIEKCINQVKNIEGIDSVNIEYVIDQTVNYSGDSFLIDLIIFNMMQNAIKFQEENIKDRIKITVDQEDNDIIMHFIDNGIGIEDEDAENIFHMYSKSAIKHQTLGLGLYIVKQSVQKLGGEIMLVNDEADLTHFRIVLPKF